MHNINGVIDYRVGATAIVPKQKIGVSPHRLFQNSRPRSLKLHMRFLSLFRPKILRTCAHGFLKTAFRHSRKPGHFSRIIGNTMHGSTSSTPTLINFTPTYDVVSRPLHGQIS